VIVLVASTVLNEVRFVMNESKRSPTDFAQYVPQTP